jgi:hypothetical protein
VPATNPFVDSADGSGVVYSPSIEALIEQDPRPGALAGDRAMNSTAGSALTQVNAAGTSENVNQHIAVTVLLVGLGIIGLHKLGFRFAAAGSVGFGK